MTCTNLDQLIATLKTNLLTAQKTLKAYQAAITEKDYSILPEAELTQAMWIARGQVTGISKSLQAAQTLKRESEPQPLEFNELEGVKLTITPGWSNK